MKYKVIKGIVPRNIDGIYFLINIYDKKCFVEGNLFTTNEMGYELFNLMKAQDIFTIDEITCKLIRNLIDFKEEMYCMILSDVKDFVQKLNDIGYIEEVK